MRVICIIPLEATPAVAPSERSQPFPKLGLLSVASFLLANSGHSAELLDAQSLRLDARTLGLIRRYLPPAPRSVNRLGSLRPFCVFQPP